MKGEKSRVIPLEPDTHEALAAALKVGGSAKVALQGGSAVFLMTKAEKGGDYELEQLTNESSSDEMRVALEKIQLKFE